jgi:hypothetical protein
MALAAEPEMFDMDVVPIPPGGADDPATAKIMKLFMALRIHTLGNHVDLSGYFGKCTPARLLPRWRFDPKVVHSEANFSTEESR